MEDNHTKPLIFQRNAKIYRQMIAVSADVIVSISAVWKRLPVIIEMKQKTWIENICIFGSATETG